MRIVQKVTYFFGLAFVAAAILGFMTGGMSMDASMATAPRLGGLFPVNVMHNGVHLLLGVWGLMAGRTPAGARRYCLFSGAGYLILAGVGFVLPETFGLVPIGGNDITLHAVLGIVLTLVGAMSDTEEAAVAARP